MKEKTLNWIRDITICLGIFLLGIFVSPFQKQINQDEVKVVYEKSCDDTLSLSCVKLYLEKHKLKFSHIILAQAKLESNNLTSNLARTNKNIFGMRVAAQRFTFASNSHDYGNYAKYETLEDCILDYKAWQIQNAFFITTDEQYFQLLSKHYAEDPNYVNALKKIIK